MAKRKKAVKRVVRRKVAPKSKRLAGGTQATGCKYSVTWKRLTSTRGYVQVWVPKKTYDNVARQILKFVRPEEKRSLRQRISPLGVSTTCGGTCSGGWCKEVMIEGDDKGGSFACECAYFV